MPPTGYIFTIIDYRTPLCPLSGPLKPKATGVHLIDPIQASQAYMLTQPVASHKVEDSEAHLPTLPSTGYIFTIFGYRTQLWPPFWPLKTQSNESTSSRPHLGVPGLHADRVRCIPQGRRFRGRIPKLSHPNIASLSLGRAPFWLHITQSNVGTSRRPLTGLLCLHIHGVRCLPQGRKFRGSIPKLYLSQVILSPLFGYRAQMWASFCPLITQNNRGTPSRPNTSPPPQAYMLTGPVASHKVEDSEAASPNFASHWLYFHHYWLQTPTWPPFSPLKTQSNGRSRPMSLLLFPYNSKERGYT